MMLVEDGKLRLDDPVSKYIPAFADIEGRRGKARGPTAGTLVLEPLERPITILDLLRHTSGITYGFYRRQPGAQALCRRRSLQTAISTNAEFAARIAKLPLAEQPGTRWDYGHSTDVLGRVDRGGIGKTLLQFEKERLLDPLGMSETAFYVADPAKRPRIAEPMPNDRAISPTTEIRDPLQPRNGESGGAGLVGTVGDYARFARCCSMAARSRAGATSSPKPSH